MSYTQIDIRKKVSQRGDVMYEKKSSTRLEVGRGQTRSVAVEKGERRDDADVTSTRLTLAFVTALVTTFFCAL